MHLWRWARARGLAPVLVCAAALSAAAPAAAEPATGSFQGEEGGLSSLRLDDARVAPSKSQQRHVRRLRARAGWNRFGTPASLIRPRGGALATGLPANPVAAARAFLRDNRRLYRLRPADVTALDVVNVSRIGRGRVVLLRQRFGTLRPTQYGLIAVAVRRGRVLYVSSSSAGGAGAPAPATLSPVQAFARLAADIGRRRTAADISRVKREAGWAVFKVDGLLELQRARIAAFPTVRDGVRAAYEVWYVDPLGKHGTEAVRAFVDARSGAVLYRHNAVLHAVGCTPGSTAPGSNTRDFSPDWCVFPANPPLDYSATDTRQVWCWRFSSGCLRTLDNEAPRGSGYGEWDSATAYNVLFGGSQPTYTTVGNNAVTARQWLDPLTGTGEQYRPISPDRDYRPEWTNAWHESRCDPASFLVPDGNDSDASVVNLFAGHNRMHDWSYALGFDEQHYNQQLSNFGRGLNGPGAPESREGDPQRGNAQAGALSGGPPTFLGRDNANMIPLPDGVSTITNMYLWEPIAASFYAPCVDGDYDMSIIGHEYTHAISNRMAAGPDGDLGFGAQSGAMGESWSDIVALEYLHEYGFVPTGSESPWAVGPYATGNPQRGIRNYPVSANPLNYSDIGYDTTGVQVHADGEIWNGVNHDIRQAMVGRHGNGTPATQAACANGRRPVQVCPGNRRWMQIVFDAFLLLQPDATMLDARDAYLAADRLRFGGADEDLLWNAFARRGFGVEADTRHDADEPDPHASFESPHAASARLRFVPASKDGGPAPKDATFYVGDYEGDVTPVADTVPRQEDEARPRSDTARLAPGTYRFVARAPGFGLVRFMRTLSAGESSTVTVQMPRNLASVHSGAKATGDASCDAGTPPDPTFGCAEDRSVLRNLIDDTEATSWRSDGKPAGRNRVFIDLAGTTPHTIRQVKVSAFPNPVDADLTAPGDEAPIARNRFSTLRQFEVKVCTATSTADCSRDAHYRTVLTSAGDAFPGTVPRPVAPELILRAFPLSAPVAATHVQLHVLHNQCTGQELYHRPHSDTNDPLNSDADCREDVQAERVTAAEFQVNSVTG